MGGRRPPDTLSQAESWEKCRKERTAAIRDQPVVVASGSLEEDGGEGGVVNINFTALGTCQYYVPCNGSYLYILS